MATVPINICGKNVAAAIPAAILPYDATDTVESVILSNFEVIVLAGDQNFSSITLILCVKIRKKH